MTPVAQRFSDPVDDVGLPRVISAPIALYTFCVMVVDECQHCSGSHPFAKIFSKHYTRADVKGQLRVLGVSTKLVKSKTKGVADQQQTIKKLERLLDSYVHDLSSTEGGSAHSLPN